jgi:N-carbamoylputrescine amidase
MNLTGYATGPEILSIARPLNRNSGQKSDEKFGKNTGIDLNTAPEPKAEIDLTRLFASRAKELGMTILVGLAEKTRQTQVYASHLIFYPNGSFDVYRKIHTAPFEKKFFLPGNSIQVFSSHGVNFGIQLCYDAHFPELTLAMALKKADIIFIPHASPRGSSREKYESWIRHLRARAFDNGVYIAACNQTGDNHNHLFFPGISLFIGPDGNVIDHCLDSAEGVHYIEIQKSALNRVRSHKMRYFLPNRRTDLFDI